MAYYYNIHKSDNIVKCWCCAYYDIINTRLKGIPETMAGVCTLTDNIVYANDEVCVDFLLNSGLHTDKSIPDYCINHRQKAPQK